MNGLSPSAHCDQGYRHQQMPTIELKNHRIIGWKRPLRSSSPAVTPTPPCLLNHVSKCHIYTVFEPLQGWSGLHHCPGQPGPTPDHSFCEEMFPYIQSKSPLMQLEAISSCPIAGYLGEETSPHLTTLSCQVVVESNEVPLSLLFSRLNSPSSLSHSSSDLFSRPLTSLTALLWTCSSTSMSFLD